MEYWGTRHIFTFASLVMFDDAALLSSYTLLVNKLSSPRHMSAYRSSSLIAGFKDIYLQTNPQLVKLILSGQVETTCFYFETLLACLSEILFS